MLKLRKSVMAEDEQGNEVFLAAGTQVWDISDAGPTLIARVVIDDHVSSVSTSGWNVSFRVHHPSISAYEEVVTMDTVKLLKALEGQRG